MSSRHGGTVSPKKSRSNSMPKYICYSSTAQFLPRPHSNVIVTSKHANMKERKVVFPQHRAELRVLYAFDPRRAAILLIGGDKTGNPKWYDEYVPVADRLFDDHLRQMEKEEQKHGKELP